jgi:chaperone required for assembly of F1-ATPase
MVKRFYTSVTTGQAETGYFIALDAHRLKTPAKRDLYLPTQTLATVLAEEWEAQDEEILPASMPIMRLVATAIDRVGDALDATIASFVDYGSSDMLLYRAEVPPQLVKHQEENWSPMLAWAQKRFDLAFNVTNGVLPVDQPAGNAARLINIVGRDVFRVSGLAHGAALLGSAILTLALEAEEISAERAHALSSLEALFQIDEWGADAEAMARLEQIALDIQALNRYFSALKP